MPFLRWRGIDLEGNLHTGIMAARTVQELEASLLQRDIACLHSTLAKPYRLCVPVSLPAKRHFFKQLAVLLDAGVFLDTSLTLLAAQIQNRAFKAVVQDVHTCVVSGQFLGTALQQHPAFFDRVTYQLVEAGQTGGNMAQALHRLCAYHDQTIEFSKKIRAALCMPIVTLLFFCVVTCIIFVAIVPALGTILLSTGKPLPPTTLLVMRLSDTVNSIQFVYAMVGGGLALGGCLCMLAHSRLKKRVHRALFGIPLVGHIIHMTTLATFFQSLVLTTQSGVHIIPALRSAVAHVHNEYMKELLHQLTLQVEQGALLPVVLQEYPQLFSDHIQSLITVGQESSCLPFVFEQIAASYKERAQRILHLVSVLVQPVFMILLGLLIMLLIAAVYVPLLTVSSVIQ